MPKPGIVLTRGAFIGALLPVLAGCESVLKQGAGPAAATLPAVSSTPPAASTGARSGFLYGRITVDGGAYEGRLRWGGDQEAFWGDFFDGAKAANPWAAYAPRTGRSQQHTIELFGFTIAGRDPSSLRRRFLARFGDIARIDASFATVAVTLKSGTIVTLDRFAAGDIDDGIRVWDRRGGVVDLDARRIRRVEFLPTPPLSGAPGRLYGTVRTRQGGFVGFIQWNQQDSVSTDTLDGRTRGGDVSLPYGSIRTIARRSRDSALVTLVDGQTLVLFGSREAGQGTRGVSVDDTRYGRVLVSWDAFERVDFSPAGSGPAYEAFPPGRPLAGRVLTRDGRRLAGRLVYDLDETETTETLDAPSGGVDYAIPFSLIASIVPASRESPGADAAMVVFHGGGGVALERGGDLGDQNAGLLVFAGGREPPVYIPWAEIERIDIDPPAGALGAGR